MVLTVEEYSKQFPSKGKILSSKTIIRKCIDGLLPSNHIARQLPCGDDENKKGMWIIEIADEVPEIKATKLDPVKPDIKTLNRKYFNIR